jgi:5-methylcytosine-specific restriction endonuclease McrA
MQESYEETQTIKVYNEEQIFQHKDRVTKRRDKALKFAESRYLTPDPDSKEFQQRAKTRCVNAQARKFTFNDHPVSVEDIVQLYKEQEGCCAACYISFDTESYELDHKNSLFNMGSNRKDNCQLLCRTCNTIKKDKDYYKWISAVRYYQVIDYLNLIGEEVL